MFRNYVAKYYYQIKGTFFYKLTEIQCTRDFFTKFYGKTNYISTHLYQKQKLDRLSSGTCGCCKNDMPSIIIQRVSNTMWSCAVGVSQQLQSGHLKR